MEEDDYKDSIALINRDLGRNLDDVYQIQGIYDQNYIIFSNIGRFDKIPINCIYKHNTLLHKTCFCNTSNILYSLIEYNITKSQLNTDDLLKMIGYTISIDDILLGTLDFVFVSDSYININDIDLSSDSKFPGSFEIIFSKIEKNIILRNSLIKIDKYPGNEEIIYLLSSYLLDINIK